MTTTGPEGHRRAHTGRRRNEEARQAILDAALRLLTTPHDGGLNVDLIAREAGVGKQTIYRWWQSKGAVLLEALTDWSDSLVPVPDTGSLREDLCTFLAHTFRRAGEPATSAVLRTLAAEAARDPGTAELFRQFTQTRRDALHAIVRRGRERGEIGPERDLELLVDQAYGLFWYRFLLGNEPLDQGVAERLTDSLVC
ncbi:TetR/AcrR family transcriptional regulator [Plantactinospora endophytica]|uniref:TetR/AcrR family transcriptional regulator n=1 Tax=Plantactinospora endophytica TaxID=673535 RepID=UPI0019419BF5|nr:TetR/AcrR family transcriptional regulator [Plantactinospora endophytica]